MIEGIECCVPATSGPADVVLQRAANPYWQTPDRLGQGVGVTGRWLGIGVYCDILIYTELWSDFVGYTVVPYTDIAQHKGQLSALPGIGDKRVSTLYMGTTE